MSLFRPWIILADNTVITWKVEMVNSCFKRLQHRVTKVWCLRNLTCAARHSLQLIISGFKFAEGQDETGFQLASLEKMGLQSPSTPWLVCSWSAGRVAVGRSTDPQSCLIWLSGECCGLLVGDVAVVVPLAQKPFMKTKRLRWSPHRFALQLFLLCTKHCGRENGFSECQLLLES